jgi:MMP 1-O-methyltransferase
MNGGIMTNLYLELSAGVPGWCRGEEARRLFQASFEAPVNAVIVEIGSFLGSSSILLAGARKVRGSGKVHCVDPFDGSGDPPSIPHYRRIMSEIGGGSLREHFDANIRRADVSEWIEVHQALAVDVPKLWTTPIDLLFLDGDQTPEGVRAAYDPWFLFLKPNGLLVAHNSNPRAYAEGHDGHRQLVLQEIQPPGFHDIELVDTTTFARKAG